MASNNGEILDRCNRACSSASIRYSVANLRTFPCVRILEEKDRLALHGAWFDIADGDLWLMDEATGDFTKAG